MANKEQLVNLIKQWISLDDKIKDLNSNLKNFKKEQKEISSNLLNVMKDNEIDCFDVNSSKILYCKNKSKIGLNKKNLLENLEKYFNGRDDINTTEIRDFIFENRETRVKENIKRKVNSSV
tara:strand:- start:9743 stop:10105 length:363 start_codon:yes stop_codon:yes gene_type:complete